MGNSTMQCNPISALFSSSDGDYDRGQVGIGTLIVFIAMVLVAAIAAGVLVNTAGFLQQSAEQAGQESADAVTQRLDISAITGHVDSGALDTMTIVVQRSAGADTIDTRDVTIQVISKDTSEVLTHEEGITVKDTTGSTVSDTTVFMLDEKTDRLKLEISPGSGALSGLDLQAGDQATLKITTASGATSHLEITVPDPATDGYHEL